MHSTSPISPAGLIYSRSIITHMQSFEVLSKGTREFKAYTFKICFFLTLSLKKEENTGQPD
jgi:hypothetical protein